MRCRRHTKRCGIAGCGREAVLGIRGVWLCRDDLYLIRHYALVMERSLSGLPAAHIRRVLEPAKANPQVMAPPN